MTDLCLLKKVIIDSGVPLSVIARKTNISRESLYNKINGKTEFKASEMNSLAIVLKLSDEMKNKIFFAKKVN